MAQRCGEHNYFDRSIEFKVPAIVHPAMHIDFFERLKTTEECSAARLFTISNNPNFAYLKQKLAINHEKIKPEVSN